MKQEAAKGKGAFLQAMWTLHAKSKLYRLAYKSWKRYGPQILTTWTQLDQAVLNGCYGEKWSDTVFQVPDSCPIRVRCTGQKGRIVVMYFTCVVFRNTWTCVSNTYPFCRAPILLRAP
ncbi:hypothetical protein TNIN_418051 [Trichonephila inaurata madagascariensis]|uniref:Uncharacterized protein n=1 Tax=Trichonephila inaurata madagascariensis TaxID=2747483 RepID=A0A8X6Y6V8_9ARAC|nr:hypothetical protein TNIN_418051 [Trichonephila inaurata madagascariensis]